MSGAEPRLAPAASEATRVSPLGPRLANAQVAWRGSRRVSAPEARSSRRASHTE